MDFNPFRLDVDDLINDFAEGHMTLLADFKSIWLLKKLSCIFEAKPNTKLSFFMQSLYAHCIGYMTSTASMSHRLGGLYCLYCLHETQPFKPPFRIYICIREFRRLKELVIDAKKENIGVVSLLVSSMLQRNLFFYGAIDLKEGSVEERVNELTEIQNARVQHANKKLFADTQIERYIHMDMGKEVEVDSLKKLSKGYSIAKELAIKEAGKVIDTQDVNHIAKDDALIGDMVRKTVEDWNLQKEMFYQKTGVKQLKLVENQHLERQNSHYRNIEDVTFNENSVEEDVTRVENDDNFCDELEQELLSVI